MHKLYSFFINLKYQYSKWKNELRTVGHHILPNIIFLCAFKSFEQNPHFLTSNYYSCNSWNLGSFWFLNIFFQPLTSWRLSDCQRPFPFLWYECYLTTIPVVLVFRPKIGSSLSASSAYQKWPTRHSDFLWGGSIEV